MDTKIWIVLFIIVLVLIYYYYTILKKDESDDPPDSSSGETLESKYPSDPTQLTILLNSKERTVATLSSTMPDSPRITELQQEIEEIKALLNNSTSSTPINIETPKDLLDYIISESDKLETTYQIIKQNIEKPITGSDVPALVSKLNTVFDYSIAINNYFTSMLPSLVEVSKDTKDIENIRECIGIICMNVSQIVSVLYHDNIMDMFDTYNEILPKNVASMNTADKTSAMITYLNSIKTIVLNHANNYQLYINVMNSLVDVINIKEKETDIIDFISANISDMYKVVKEDLDELTSFILSFDKNEYNVVISDVVTKISEYKVANDKFKGYADKEYNIDRNINYSGLGSSYGKSFGTATLDAFLGIDPNKESMEYNIPGTYTQKTGEPNTRYFIRGKYYGPPGKLYVPHMDLPSDTRYLNAGYRADKEEDAGVIIEPFTTPEGYPVVKYEIKDDKLTPLFPYLFAFNKLASVTHSSYGNHIILHKIRFYNSKGERYTGRPIQRVSTSQTTAANIEMLKKRFNTKKDIFHAINGTQIPTWNDIIEEKEEKLYVFNLSTINMLIGVEPFSNQEYTKDIATVVLAYDKKFIEDNIGLDKFKTNMDAMMFGATFHFQYPDSREYYTMLKMEELNDTEIGYVFNARLYLENTVYLASSVKLTNVPGTYYGKSISLAKSDVVEKSTAYADKEKYSSSMVTHTSADNYTLRESYSSQHRYSRAAPVLDNAFPVTATSGGKKIDIPNNVAFVMFPYISNLSFDSIRILRYTFIYPDSDLVMPLTNKVFYKNYNNIDGGVCVDEINPATDLVFPTHDMILEVTNVKKKKANHYMILLYDVNGMRINNGSILYNNYYGPNQKLMCVVMDGSGDITVLK